MEIEKKFGRDKLKFNRISNRDLVCADCVNQYDDSELPCNTSRCIAYPRMKPYEVLSGANCPEKKVVEKQF